MTTALRRSVSTGLSPAPRLCPFQETFESTQKSADDDCSAPLFLYWSLSCPSLAPLSSPVSLPPRECPTRHQGRDELRGNALLAIRDGMDFVVPSRSPKAYWTANDDCSTSPCYHRQLNSFNTHLSSPFLSVSSCTYTPHPPLFATRYLCIALGPLPAAMARIPLVISACVVSTCFFSLTPHPPLFATRYLCSALGPLPAAIGNLTCIVCLFFVLYACPPSPFIPILTRYLFNALGPLPAAIGNLTCILVPLYLFNALGPLPAAIGNLTFLSAM
ncbi:unnamed protein product [Closterium sp. Naga37s-1]|nr:unnamed protein product [Closterium sp. Naga37s-1]